MWRTVQGFRTAPFNLILPIEMKQLYWEPAMPIFRCISIPPMGYSCRGNGRFRLRRSVQIGMRLGEWSGKGDFANLSIR